MQIADYTKRNKFSMEAIRTLINEDSEVFYEFLGRLDTQSRHHKEKLWYLRLESNGIILDVVNGGSFWFTFKPSSIIYVLTHKSIRSSHWEGISRPSYYKGFDFEKDVFSLLTSEQKSFVMKNIDIFGYFGEVR